MEKKMVLTEEEAMDMIMKALIDIRETLEHIEHKVSTHLEPTGR